MEAGWKNWGGGERQWSRKRNGGRWFGWRRGKGREGGIKRWERGREKGWQGNWWER